MNNLVDFRFIEDYNVQRIEESFKEAINKLDFAKNFKEGMKVVLNVCIPTKADKNTAICTHPAVVEAIVKVLTEYKVSCILTASPYGNFNLTNLNNVYYASGMLEVSNKTGLDLDTSLKTTDLEITNGVKCKSVTVLEVVENADLIINIGKVKFDKRLGYLGVSTNLFGAVPGELKNTYLNRLSTQQDFYNLAMDINMALAKKTILNVLDGIVVRETSGSPRMLSALITGTNMYSTDAFLLNLLNIDYINTIIKIAGERGFVNYTTPFKQTGDSVSTINESSILPHELNLDTLINVNNFSTRSYFNKHQQLVTIKPEECKGCTVCSKICPTGAILMKYDKNGELYAHIDYKKCIYCKKCVTACPYRVVKIKTPPAYKKLNKTMNKLNNSNTYQTK